MRFSNLRPQQSFRDSYGGDIFIKQDECSARKLGIGGVLGECLSFDPNDDVDTQLGGKLYS
jgi:hypothetical protein